MIINYEIKHYTQGVAVAKKIELAMKSPRSLDKHSHIVNVQRLGLKQGEYLFLGKP